MSDLTGVFERIDGYREEIVRLQRDLTARVALGPDNGGTGEHEKTEYIKDLLNTLNPDILREIRAPDERAQGGYRPNLIGRWEGMEKGATVWVLSHSDIVPPGDLSLWNTDPYQVTVDGDRVVGRGVEDNQHGFLSSYLALKAILDSGLTLRRPVGLVIVADEETGSDYGLSYLLKDQEGCFSPEDLIIVPDAGNEDGTMIEVAEKSMLWLKFTVTGLQCHASTPQKGKNSLRGAAEMILALGALDERFHFSDPLFRPPVSTFAPTRSEENVPNVNTIPGKNIFYLDCRILPRYSVDEVISASEEMAASVSEKTGLKIRVEAVHRQEAAAPTPPHAPVVKALADAIKRVHGKQARPMGIGGGTVAAFFRRAGLPAAVWSTCPDSAHQPNEYCPIPNIITDAKIFASVYQWQE
ncbi:MAG: M20 family metallo-hydrolase [Deltaproteobacteria bacterium]|nr:M20 family metallo-hydrolase [Deltaproteobacteria bacterium]MBW2047445.1 M20 family metallo-hydrolase [Deltaproteobacteria bacterium]MBW2112048.1 M20 family metallo-hydrolase [Deltaproteobacteria bacterium]MBW2353421.1 M20 family metallo-hydrolase [Deltaproteobacteria bacterium]